MGEVCAQGFLPESLSAWLGLGAKSTWLRKKSARKHQRQTSPTCKGDKIDAVAKTSCFTDQSTVDPTVSIMQLNSSFHGPSLLLKCLLFQTSNLQFVSKQR